MTQALWSMFSVSAPSWCSLASMPLSAMKRNALPFFSVSAPSLTRLRLEEASLRACLASRAQLQALVELGDEDVPAAHAHQDEDDQRALRDEVALLPERLEAVRVVDRFLGGRRAAIGAGAAEAASAAGGRRRRRGVASGAEAACALRRHGRARLRTQRASEASARKARRNRGGCADMVILSVCGLQEGSSFDWRAARPRCSLELVAERHRDRDVAALPLALVLADDADAVAGEDLVASNGAP